MALRTDPSVQGFQHNARELSSQGGGVFTPVTVAGAGTIQTDATALTDTQRIVVTSGAAATGVRLPANMPIGSTFTIYAPVANNINLWPPTGEALGAGAANAVMVVTAGRGIQLRKIAATLWGVVKD